ncbi:MAG: elongation factor 4 [Candidatus Niyogibacteria bacterium CG10_big_fil_rev_8_21_14_0_10_42_19]|uniref:Elongation factor 4 n=1 Tax=Candidatus Niyogibacteria bacterium CG10_big_fil_rev_8_21_14_0_10_42_19 TaxID=1974725 RepID=A0A2H0TFE5_9BACT|nr:MAG: elongation factor 4 [Candidatus Niyogibacteria bacterium CG10_big_fil_rev_8_21_14_0_10_42_19]
METKPINHIRNFCIISHIDHGKSTLADRLLEITNTVEKRKMREQYLDSMDLERERGITIKMQPVRMIYKTARREYILNLIDTPGHIDFSYEVSRSLAAVEGAVLLVDASQGIQAQTLSNMDLARKQNLKIIPVINKIDLPHAQIKESREELRTLLGFDEKEIIEISGKTGVGVEKLLLEIIDKIPPPGASNINDEPQALIFDFEYSSHTGVIAYIRVMKGNIKKNDPLKLLKANELFEAGEIGTFSPKRIPKENLSAGEIGYITTNIKKPETVKVGDTLTSKLNPQPALPGYTDIAPMVWASLYPASQDDFDALKKALLKLKLVDGSLSVEEESSGALGRGFACGFLGLLHMEIIIERIKREFDLDIVTTSPNVKFRMNLKNGGEQTIHSASDFKDDGEIEKIKEPWAEIEILSPTRLSGNIFTLIEEYEASIENTEILGERMKITVMMPLRELMRDLHDNLKSASSGYASLSYKPRDYRDANLTRLDILIHEEKVPAFSQIVSPRRLERDSRMIVEKLKKIIPRQLFAFKIQAQAHGKIIASETVSALKKNVTGHLYGGDRTRKMKLWKKQKTGKKRLESLGSVAIPHETYIKMLKRQ